METKKDLEIKLKSTIGGVEMENKEYIKELMRLNEISYQKSEIISKNAEIISKNAKTISDLCKMTEDEKQKTI